ncbi:MAG TPA: 23S rRNA (guanosine(2251)-2'-O)-methyltransferase RlmB [Streptosporangiaceae bacterium]|nr:23S rRNA (guanosine(2251)-2'-O)-methyltransferase RlmB [Streptosporangiaceae bacterium]
MSGKSGKGNVSKSGKPRPGTGGYGRRKLEGKGPTPPAEKRTGHPAQRRAAAAAAAARSGGSRSPGFLADESSNAPARRPASGARGAGNAAEMVAGRNAVLEALRESVPATALHVGPRLDADERIGEAVKLAADRGIPVVEAGRSELDRLTGGAVHQGLALRVRPYSYAHADDLIEGRAGAVPLIVALDGVTDPRNLGAVARSVAAFGGNGVLVPARRSAGVTAGAWKASAGALARVPVAQAPNLASALAGYARAGLFIVGLDADADSDLAGLSLATSPLVLVVGAEGKGLSRLVRQHCDAVVKIPITGAESLNASVAAGIALYQVAQSRAGA